MPLESSKQTGLSLLCVICDRVKRDKVQKISDKHKAYFSLMTLGKGTASSKILSYLGLGETDKAVFFYILQSEGAQALFQELDLALALKKPGHGVAFTATIQDSCYKKYVVAAPQQKGGNTMEQENHDLIMIILNRGYTEEVMEAARSAKATGGTVIHAKGCGLAGAEKFFGITIQPEKELILILAEQQIRADIMQAVTKSAGISTDAGAVCFSLPVNSVSGAQMDLPESAL